MIIATTSVGRGLAYRVKTGVKNLEMNAPPAKAPSNQPASMGEMPLATACSDITNGKMVCAAKKRLLTSIQVYWNAADAESAYGAWLLFCASADHRAWTWMAVDQMGADLPPTERTLRLINYEINRTHLRSAMKKREKDFGNRFLGKKVSPHVGPWALTNHA